MYLLTGALLAVGYEIRATVILTVCSIVMYTVLQIGGVKEESVILVLCPQIQEWKYMPQSVRNIFRRAVQQSVISVVSLWQDFCWYLPHMARSAITMQDLIHQRLGIQQSTGS